jgi:hypothetical protein
MSTERYELVHMRMQNFIIREKDLERNKTRKYVSTTK